MTAPHSDALVFFGATGDLAYKKIFPALQTLVKDGQLDVPVIGVAKAGWNLDQFKARARDSVDKHGGIDKEAFDRLTGVFGARVRIADLRLGEETLRLTQYLTPQGRPIPVDSRSNDHWFQHIAIVVRDMDTAYARLRPHRVLPVSTAPQTLPEWNKAAAWCVAASILSAVGLMHSYQWTVDDTVLKLAPAWPFAAGYAIMAAIFFSARWITEPGGEH